MLLEHKNAVIYGAGGAIGGAAARAFAREGAQVFLAGRTFAPLNAVAEEIAAAGGRAEAAEVDALDEAAVESHVAAVASSAGQIDVSLNAIGMEDVQGPPLLDMSLSEFAHPVIRATRTQFLTARAIARRMVENGSGVLLTITAPTAREATPHIGGFGVACSAIEGLWRTLAAELGPHGVRLVCLRSAGSPDTPDLQGMVRAHAEATGLSPEEIQADFGRGSLLGRLPTLIEVAEVATMMASERTSPLTGTFVNVTCGSPVD